MAGAFSSAFNSAFDIGAGSSFKAAWAINRQHLINPLCDGMKKNVASQKVGAQLVSATDGSAFTGSVTVLVTGDAGTQATGSVGSGACTHEGNGYHTYAPAQAETNYDLVAFTFTGTGAVPVTVQVYTLPATGILAPATLGRTLVVDAAGLADANVVKLGPTGSGTAQTARDIGASVLLSSGTGTGQLDFTSGVVKANTTQFAGSAITSASGIPEVKLTNGAHGGAAGVLTLSRIIVASATTNEPAVKLTGNGVGGAIVATGGSTGPGAEFIGGASGGNGMSIYSQASDRGLYIQGSGSAGGVYIEGGGTGPGMYITGNTYGLEVHGGATNGTGIYATGGTATGYGIQAEAGSHAVYLHTTDGGDGIKFLGSVGGVFNTEIDAIDNYLDTEVAAIKAKTDNLPSDPADASDIAAAFSTVNSTLSTIAGYLDTEIAAILADTNELQTDWANGGRLDLILDATSTLTQTQVTGGAYALNSASFAFASALDFTTTQKTSIGTAVAASAVASVTGNVGGNVVGSVGSVVGAVGSISGVSFPSNFASLGINASGHVSRVTLADTITTYTGNTVQTGDAYAALTSAVPDTVPADGSRPTVQQAVRMILQSLVEGGVSGTTWTVKKEDGSTTLMTVTLDSATTPTSKTRSG